MKVSNERTLRSASPVLFERQRRLLTLLDALGGTAENLDFQKLLFLYCQEPEANDAYEFIPYKFGAFSFTSCADRRKLVERGLLVDDEQQWQITDKGRRAIGRVENAHVAAFARRYRSNRGDSLVAECYRRFPYYATRSEIAERVLSGDDAALASIEAARHVRRPAAISTIGYEGRSVESYLNVLLRSGITLLCDVRRNPISRKYGFSKSTLGKACDGVGIRYRHIPELGIASELRKDLETQEDYDALFADYERETLPNQAEALECLRTLVRDGQRIALTCYEQLPQQCHRHCVSDELQNRFGKVYAAKHL